MPKDREKLRVSYTVVKLYSNPANTDMKWAAAYLE